MGVTTAVLAGRLVDVVEGEVLADRAVLLDGDRVVEVVALDATPQGVDVVDLRDRWVVPGLIDCHAHLIGELDEGHGYAGLLSTTTARETLAGSRNARDTVLAGFTTVRDVGTFRSFTDIALRDAITAGWVPGPRMVCAGAYITCPGGGGDLTGLSPEDDARVPASMRVGVVRNPAEVREAVRRIADAGADVIKVIATGAVLTTGTLPGEVELGPAELEAAVDEAARHGLHVAAHAHGAEGIKIATRAGVRSIEHGSLMDDEAIALMAEHGTWLVADIYNGDYIKETGERDGWAEETLRKNEETTQTQRDGFRTAVAAGVKIAYGTDSGVYPWADAARQLPYMVRHGMTPMQGLQAATVRAAECLDRDAEVGSLRPGGYADLVALDVDPLADDLRGFASVPFVMKGGEVVKDDLV